MATYFFSELPYAAALAVDKMRIRCSNCFAESVESVSMVQCDQGCEEVVYCSESCMKNDKPSRHANECLAYRKCKTRMNDPNRNVQMRLLGRLITRLQADNGVASLSFDFPSRLGKDRRFKDLISHDRDYKRRFPKGESIVLCCYNRFINFFEGTTLETIKLAEFTHFNNVSKINGFCIASLESGEFHYFGEGVYLNASRFNHSCRPSLLFWFDGSRLIVKKVPDSKSNDQQSMTKKKFESLTFDYGVNGSFSVTTASQRQDSLERRYFFRCRCELCRDDRMNKLQLDASPVECAQCGQPYVWKSKRWSSKMKLKKSCECRVKSREAVAELVASDDVQTSLKVLAGSWDDGTIDKYEILAKKFWHPVYNLRFGQIQERQMRRLYDGYLSSKEASKPSQTQLKMALVAGEQMLKSYVHYASPYNLSMAFLLHRLATMYMMQEGEEVVKRRRGSELCSMSAEVWDNCGEQERGRYMRGLSEMLLRETTVLANKSDEQVGS